MATDTTRRSESPSAATPASPSFEPDGLHLDLAQCIRAFTGMVWITWGVNWLGRTGTLSIAPLMSAGSLIAGLVLIALAISRGGARSRALDGWILVGTLTIIGAWLLTGASLHVYGTDELTIGQASADLVLHGENPYGRDLTAQLNAFNAQPDVKTPLLSGGNVHTATYPALSFLVYVPFGAVMGTGAHYALFADGVAWIALMVLIWKLLDERLRPVVPLLASLMGYVGFVDAGVTDTLWLPFMYLALYRWDRYGDAGERTPARWMGPLMLGLACSIKPTPWLMAPFLLTAVTLEAARRSDRWLRVGARYAAITGGTFLAINAPFIVIGPRAWADGALLPLVQPLIPFGQGVVQLTMYLHTAGGHVGYLSYAGGAALLAALGVLVGGYPRTKRLVPVLAVAPLLLSTRSLPNYFLYVVILALAGASTVADETSTGEPALRRIQRAGRAVIGLGVAGTVAAMVAFLLSPAPLDLRITAQHRSPRLSGTDRVSLTVTAVNRTDAPIQPAFVITTGSTISASWNAVAGPAVLGPHAQATYEIAPSDPRTTLDKGTVFLVDALAVGPASVSTSDWTTAN